MVAGGGWVVDRQGRLGVGLGLLLGNQLFERHICVGHRLARPATPPAALCGVGLAFAGRHDADGWRAVEDVQLIARTLHAAMQIVLGYTLHTHTYKYNAMLINTAFPLSAPHESAQAA